jgi:hypothetical protein
MFFCLFSKKKIFDFIQGSLEAKQAEKVSSHIRKCKSCRKLAFEYKNLIAAAGQDKPFLGEVFWRKFDTNLELLISRQKRSKHIFVMFPFTDMRLNILPKKTFAAALAVCLILAVFFGPFKSRFWGSKTVAAVSEDKIIETAILLDDLGEPVFCLDEDDLIEEFIFQAALEDV